MCYTILFHTTLMHYTTISYDAILHSNVLYYIYHGIPSYTILPNILYYTVSCTSSHHSNPSQMTLNSTSATCLPKTRSAATRFPHASPRRCTNASSGASGPTPH